MAVRLGLAVGLSFVLCLMLGCVSWDDTNSMWDLPPSSLPREGASEEVPPARDRFPGKNPVAGDGANGFRTGSKATAKESSAQQDASSFRIDDVEAVLATPGGWIGTPAPKRDQVPWNWYHPRIEEVLAWPKENDRAIRASLAKKDPVSATNAAICLARLGDSSGASILTGAIRSPRLDMSLRMAAAEAFASLDDSAPTVQKLIDEYGDHSKTPNPDLYRELIAGLARHVDPAGDRRFLVALQSRGDEVRLAAIEAWSKSQNRVLPDALVYLAADPNEQNRSAVMRLLGTHDHPERMHYLNAGLRDINHLVRVAAVESLGQVGSKEAVDKLQETLKSSSTIVRAATVRALAEAGRPELTWELAKDPAWQVRQVVAETLPKVPNDKVVETARLLLHDRSPQVQQQTLSTIAAWPLAQSGSLLLDAIEKLGFQMRQEAITQLASSWEPARNFPRHAPEEVRRRAILELRTRFQREQGIAGEPSLAAKNSTRTLEVDPALVLRAKRLLASHNDPRCASADRYQIRQELLQQLGPAPLAVLEHLVFNERQDLPEEFYTTILPQLDPTFDVLYQMQMKTSPNEKEPVESSFSRRRAASNLIRLTAEHEPSRLALDRLAEQMLQESDTLIWRSVLIALADNGDEAMLQLVRVAIGHESAEIRRRACEWLAAHPSPAHFKLLGPALDDPDNAVKIAAVRAVVAGGRLNDTKPLQNLLSGNDPERTPEEASYLDPASTPTLTPTRTSVQNPSANRANQDRPQPQSHFTGPLPRGAAATIAPEAKAKEIASLKKLLGDSNEELQMEVAYALAAFDDEKGVQSLYQLARSRDATVRQKAAEAMGRLEDPRYTSLLIHMLDDHLNVQRAALHALPKTVGQGLPAAGDGAPETPAQLTARWKQWYNATNASRFGADYSP